MNPWVTKGVLGLTVSAAVAGVTGIVVKLSKKEILEPVKIKTLLEKNKPEKRLLFKKYQDKEDGSSQEWRDVWKKYQTDHKDAGKDPFGLLTKPITPKEENTPFKFMESCEGLFEEEVMDINSDKYKIADDYCTRLTSIADLIWETKYKVLSKGNDGNSEDWKRLWKKYRENNLGKDTGKDEWEVFEQKWESANDQNAATEKFRDKCQKESQIKTGDKSHASYQKVIDYCSVPR